MRDQYHEDIDSLADLMVEMTRLVGSAINRATQALLDGDLDIAESVISADREVDAMYEDAEHRALDLLARQQPVARDLRIIVTSLRMVADLERMGDLALHIAKLARMRYPAKAVPADLSDTILEMGQVAQRIVTKCGAVIARQDLAMAQELERDDDVMDGLHRRLFTVLLSPEWQGGTECAIDVTLCGRYYERYCDHAVSVARRVVFLVTGQKPLTAA